MQTHDGTDPAQDFVYRLRDAINGHDIETMTACFARDYLNETPIHPARGFRGRDQVRKNWTQLFAGVPDITATVLRSAGDGDTAWSEWEMAGTRSDGSRFLMRGVGIFGVSGNTASWCRFYLDPVDEGSTDIDAATAAVVQGHPQQREGTNTP